MPIAIERRILMLRNLEIGRFLTPVFAIPVIGVVLQVKLQVFHCYRSQ